jgi:hypothetical protein
VKALRLIVAASMLCLWAEASRAAEKQAVIPLEFLQFIESPEFFALISERIVALEPAPLRDVCPTITPLRRQGWSPVDYPEWSYQKNAVVYGTWIERVLVDRCGGEALRRVLVTAKPDGELIVSLLVPGGFLGNYRLEFEARKLVAQDAMARNDCSDMKRFFVTDTRVVQTPSRGRWAERWSVIACGAPDVVDVYFGPSSTGAYASLAPPK